MIHFRHRIEYNNNSPFKYKSATNQSLPQSMYKNELSIISIKPSMAYGELGRKPDIPGDARITYLFGLLHFEKQKEMNEMTWAQVQRHSTVPNENHLFLLAARKCLCQESETVELDRVQHQQIFSSSITLHDLLNFIVSA